MDYEKLARLQFAFSIGVTLYLVAAAKRPRIDDEDAPVKRQRVRNNSDRARRRAYVEAELLQLPDPFFKRMFRMPKAEFLFLVAGITPVLRGAWTAKSQRMAIVSSGVGDEVSPFLLLAATIRWLAGGSVCDIAFMLKICDKTIHHQKYEVMRAINKLLEGDIVFEYIFRLSQTLHFKATSSFLLRTRLYACSPMNSAKFPKQCPMS